MKEKVQDIIRHNNEKRKLLHKENQEYYENLMVYIRSHNKEERATEELLLELLDHLLEAQKDGKSAIEVFGKKPKELADEMIESLPEESLKSRVEFGLELGFTLFGWFFVVWGIIPFIEKQDKTIYAGSLILSSILLLGGLLLLIYLVLEQLKKEAFEASEKKKKVSIGLGVLVGVLFLLGFLVNLFIEPFGPTFEVSYYTPFGLGCFFLLASYLLKKMRVAQ
jgi:uncharacterized membrane-anchored protein